MTKTRIIYNALPMSLRDIPLTPWGISRNIWRHRRLIKTTVSRNFNMTYRGSYLGICWQFLLPMIMFMMFYIVFGKILGGRFSQEPAENPLEYAIALIIGLALHHFLAQTLNNSCNLVVSNRSFVKTMAYPLEILSVSTVFSSSIPLLVSLSIALGLVIMMGQVTLTLILLPVYLLSVFLLALGSCWFLSAISVFVKDIGAVMGPVTLILLFCSAVFFPLDMASEKIRWIVQINPMALIINGARNAVLFNTWDSWQSLTYILLFSFASFILGHFVFMRLKNAFGDVL